MKKRTYEEDTRFGWVVGAASKGGNHDKKYRVGPYQGDNNTTDPDRLWTWYPLKEDDYERVDGDCLGIARMSIAQQE